MGIGEFFQTATLQRFDPAVVAACAGDFVDADNASRLTRLQLASYYYKASVELPRVRSFLLLFFLFLFFETDRRRFPFRRQVCGLVSRER